MLMHNRIIKMFILCEEVMIRKNVQIQIGKPIVFMALILIIIR